MDLSRLTSKLLDWLLYWSAAVESPTISVHFVFLGSGGEDFFNRSEWYWSGGLRSIFADIRGDSTGSDISYCRWSKRHLEHLLECLVRFVFVFRLRVVQQASHLWLGGLFAIWAGFPAGHAQA